jgi:hypothetical protein
MKRVHGLDLPQTLEEICDLLSIALRDAVFTDSEAFCMALQRKPGLQHKPG